MSVCPECGAHYQLDRDSCAARFEQLLALDHSRQEPWGSRHGQAFASFTLQHPLRYPASLDRAWQALYRIYVLNESSTSVLAAMRRPGEALPAVPARPSERASAPALTIADLGEFGAETYAAALDDWCRASLRSWGLASR